MDLCRGLMARFISLDLRFHPHTMGRISLETPFISAATRALRALSQYCRFQRNSISVDTRTLPGRSRIIWPIIVFFGWKVPTRCVNVQRMFQN